MAKSDDFTEFRIILEGFPRERNNRLFRYGQDTADFAQRQIIHADKILPIF